MEKHGVVKDEAAPPEQKLPVGEAIKAAQVPDKTCGEDAASRLAEAAARARDKTDK